MSEVAPQFLSYVYLFNYQIIKIKLWLMGWMAIKLLPANGKNRRFVDTTAEAIH